MKYIIFALSLLVSMPAFAGLPFESFFGSYKIVACTYEVNQNPVQNDPGCAFDGLLLDKDGNGGTLVTETTAEGSLSSESLRVYDRQDGEYHDQATFQDSGDYQVWSRSIDYPDGKFSLIDIVFRLDQNKKLTFTVTKHSEKNGAEVYDTVRTFELVRK